MSKNSFWRAWRQVSWRLVSDTRIVHYLPHFSGIFAILFSLIWYAIWAAVMTATLWWQVGRFIPSQLTSLYQELRTNWPAELELTYNGQQWSGWEQLPTVISYPPAWQPGLTDTPLLATITATPTNPSKHQPAALANLSPEKLWLHPQIDTGQLTPIIWPEVIGSTPLTLNRAVMDQLYTSWQAQQNTWLALTIIITFLALWLLKWLWRLLILLVYVFIVWLMWRVFGLSRPYAWIWRLGLFWLPVAEGLVTLWSILYPRLPLHGDFWWIWLLLMSVASLLLRLKSAPPQTDPR